MPTEVIMPQLGDSVSEGTVSKWLKREGEWVQEFDPLLEVSGDKIDTEIPAPASGIIMKIMIPVGQVVTAGACLALIDEHSAQDTPDKRNSEADQHGPEAANGTGTHRTGFVSPVVARMAAEHQLDLSHIIGTGRDGRITKKDVEAYLAHPSAPAAKVQPQPAINRVSSLPAPIIPTTGEIVPLSAMRRTIAEHMVKSKLHTAPHVTTVFELDMSAVNAHRKANKEAFAQQGVNLTLTAYFAVATASVLQHNRYLNAQWTDEGIILHQTVNLGIAVALDEGLIVPVIKHAGDLNLLGMARAINDAVERARSKQLRSDDVQGGTFTITNHGVSGSLLATPIINQPQSAILGVGLVEKRVKVIDDMIAIRSCCYVTLTFDHRVADGATGDQFMSHLKDRIERWE